MTPLDILQVAKDFVARPRMAVSPRDLDDRIRSAVSFYWRTLDKQSKKQRKTRAADGDRGGRAGVTGGKQMDGFAQLIREILVEGGWPKAHVHLDKLLELPGYFRPTKKWDLVVVKDGTLVAAMELKSQTGPSFGNNLNNRVEEAVGIGQDLRTAYREGAFKTGGQKPWVGNIMLLEDCPASQRSVSVKEPHFKVFPEFRGTSYAKRYELFLQRLVREELYTRAALLLSTRTQGKRGDFSEPAVDLRIRDLFVSLIGHVGTILGGRA